MGWTCVIALPVGLIGVAAGDSALWSWILTFALAGPMILAGLHLELTRFLTREQRAAWRHGLFRFWTPENFFIAWEYLFSRDLTRADFRRNHR